MEWRQEIPEYLEQKKDGGSAIGDSLNITENSDGSFTMEWDEKDPEWNWLNGLTSKEIQSIIEKALELDEKNEEPN